MICVAMLQAVEKLCGFSIRVSVITVPFWSMSSRFTSSQLLIGPDTYPISWIWIMPSSWALITSSGKMYLRQMSSETSLAR